MKSGIYCILNLLNGKVYIGSAVNVNSRLHTHKSKLNLNKHPSKHLQGAYNQYGEFAFEFIIVEHVIKTALLEREEVWFQLTDCCNPLCGYNKRKIPNSNLGLKLGPASNERKLKLKVAHTGRIISQEQRDAISKTPTGRKLSADHIANAINGRAGYRHSEETKLKMAVSKKDIAKWPHGYNCNCRECLNKKNLERRLKRYNHEGEFSL